MTQNQNLVKIIDGEARIDSLAIAEQCEIQHKNVMELIRNNAQDFQEFGNSAFETRNRHGAGRPTEVALLNEAQATLLITYMRNTEVVRAFKKTLVKEFQLLKMNGKAINVRDPGQLSAIAIQLIEVNRELEAQIAEAQPKIEAFDRIADSDGSFCVTDAAKALQMRPKDLFNYLSQHGWTYKRAGASHWLGYQAKVTQGLLQHKVTTVLRPDGSEKITEQVRITAKGLEKLALLIPPSAQAA